MPRPPDQRSPETPWPQWPLRLRESSSHAEGCRRIWGVTTYGYEDDGTGGVASVLLRGVEWKAETPGGRLVPCEVPGTEQKIPAQWVLLAMGFVGPESDILTDSMGFEKTERGFPKTDEDGMTSVPGIFVSGDMGRGASLVVRAIADGVKVAGAIQRRLDNQKGMRQE